METLERILEEAKKLSVEDQQRLRAALGALALNGNVQSAAFGHERERAWIDAHRGEYGGQWVALDGNKLLASGPDARQVYEAARRQGSDAPYLDQVSNRTEAFIGGWQ